MVKIFPTSESKTEYEVLVRVTEGDRSNEWHVGYFIRSGTTWLFKPVAASLYGEYMMRDIAAELAKLNGTTLS